MHNPIPANPEEYVYWLDPDARRWLGGQLRRYDHLNWWASEVLHTIENIEHPQQRFA